MFQNWQLLTSERILFFKKQSPSVINDDASGQTVDSRSEWRESRDEIMNARVLLKM